MRSTLRSLTFGLAATLAGATMAQQPYTILVTGVISSCYPGQMVNIETNVGTQPYLNFDVPVNPNTCTWSATLNVASDPASFTANTQCNGMIVSSIGVAQFDFMMDSVALSMSHDCGGNLPVDCNGVLNGPDMPGTSCDDGNPMTWGDVWTPFCVCAGEDTSSTYDCLGVPNGQNLPGTFCINFFGDTGIWSVDCSCVTNGTPDCLGNPGGGQLPGTPCIIGNQLGIWSPYCVCVPDTSMGYYDCYGLFNGSNLPGTPCTYTPDNGTTWVTSIWSPDCICGPDSNVFFYDCLGIANGPNLPGNPCTVPGTIIEGTWSSACVCVPNGTGSCEASFWVLQAYGSDSLPVPYELWVWNLSSGGNGAFISTWDFGDGTSSTDPYPSHTYAGNGPYNLCLTIVDNNGCTDTFCDSISIDGDGMYNGMMGEEGDRSEGFTLNVQQPQANGVEELSAINEIVAWPNPVAGELNVAMVNGLRGTMDVTITDLNGRVVRSERRVLAHGRNQMSFSTNDLGAGMYTLRIGNSLSLRFVKTN